MERIVTVACFVSFKFIIQKINFEDLLNAHIMKRYGFIATTHGSLKQKNIRKKNSGKIKAHKTLNT